VTDGVTYGADGKLVDHDGLALVRIERPLRDTIAKLEAALREISELPGDRVDEAHGIARRALEEAWK